MVPPDPLLAPVILPVIVPTVQAKVLPMLEVKVMFGPSPLHVTAVGAFVTDGAGLTVTVMDVVGPTHEPVEEVGTTL